MRDGSGYVIHLPRLGDVDNATRCTHRFGEREILRSRQARERRTGGDSGPRGLAHSFADGVTAAPLLVRLREHDLQVDVEPMKARGIAEHQLRLAHGKCLDEGRQIAEAQGPSRGHDGDGSGGRQRLGLEGCGAGRLRGLGRVQPARQEAVSEVADAATGRTDVQKRLPKVGAPVANQVGLVDEDEVEAKPVRAQQA